MDEAGDIVSAVTGKKPLKLNHITTDTNTYVNTEVTAPKPTHDKVNHPQHYISDPSGVECIEITRHRNFNVGNGIKYLWRAGLKEDVGMDVALKEIEDLEKCVWYIKDEIERLKKVHKVQPVTSLTDGIPLC